MKRLLSLILALSMLTCAFSGAVAEETAHPIVPRPYFEQVDTLESKTLPLYVDEPESTQEVEVWTINGVDDIAYITLETAAQLLRAVAVYAEYDGYEIDYQSVESNFFLTRENGAFAWFDLAANTITLNDPDLFARHPEAVNSLDLVEPATANEDGEIRLFRAIDSYYRGGDALVYELNDYNIFTVYRDGQGYIPLQTFSDVLLSLFPMFALYNGECVILATGIINSDSEPNELGEIYYQAEKHQKSEELAIFNYYELCMALDHTYGLMEEHDIDSFMSFFAKTSLVEDLLTYEAGDTYAALTDMTCGYFSDFHSAPQSMSYMASEGSGQGDPMKLSSMMGMFLSRIPYSTARSTYYPDGIVGYEEVGNTAFITFDSFKYDSSRDYYNTEITNNASDTVELLIYANQQINREDSPIENVVLDVSLNGGGMIDVAMFVVAWYIGTCNFNLVNVKTGAQAYVSYQFDANLDHTIGGDDSLYDMFGSRNLYCITSGTSFSCANLVPAAFKSSGKVTIIGKTSGGGACSVCVMSTADGNVFQLSSPMRASTVKNGTFYSVDEGVTPDVYIDKIEHLYDRQYLADLINNLD